MQRYLALRGVREVAVPFAAVLADLVPADAVRTRRDFPQLLTAVQTVAFLHQQQRERTPEGWVVATIDDYVRAREVFASCFDLVAAEGVTKPIRAIVAAVPEDGEITVHDLARRVGRAESTVSYHLRRAIERGWLVNDAPRGRAGYKVRRGSPLPETTSALPEPDRLREIFESSSHFREKEMPRISIPSEGSHTSGAEVLMDPNQPSQNGREPRPEAERPSRVDATRGPSPPSAQRRFDDAGDGKGSRRRGGGPGPARPSCGPPSVGRPATIAETSADVVVAESMGASSRIGFEDPKIPMATTLEKVDIATTVRPDFLAHNQQLRDAPGCHSALVASSHGGRLPPGMHSKIRRFLS